jgi:GH24 family phage-related lysozyme (muramidase)
MSIHDVLKSDTVSASRTRSTPKYFHDDIADSPRHFGVYMGIVKNTQDIQHMGRLQVFLPDWGGDEDNQKDWKMVSYCAPFGGSTPAMERFWKRDVGEYDYTPTSYGFWAVPPDVGNKVLVMFINGDETRGVWIGSMYDSFMNFNVPGLAASDKHNNPEDTVHKFQNVTEYNKFNRGVASPLEPVVRPYHKRQYERMSQTAQHEDPYRGWTTSSAQRETPSAVYGMSTPGPIDTLATNVGETFKRSGGHQFVMDDGDVNGNNRLIRLRARGGAQLLIHDTLGFVYICNKMGTAWVELDRNGNVEVYSNNSISLRANEDINMRADRDFNLDIGRDLNVYMPADYETNEEKQFQTDLHTGTGSDFDPAKPNFAYSKVSGLKSNVPNGSIVLQVKEGEVHTTVETGNVYNTMGAGDYHNRLRNGNYFRQIDAGYFNGLTNSNHFQKVGRKAQYESIRSMTIVSEESMILASNKHTNISTLGTMDVTVKSDLFMSAGKDFHRTAGGIIAEDATNIYHNDGNSEVAKRIVKIDDTFSAVIAQLPALKEFEDMIKYDPKKGPTMEKVDRRLTRYPTMEPYGGLSGAPGEGTMMHYDVSTTGSIGLVVGESKAETPVLVDTHDKVIPVGKFNAESISDDKSSSGETKKPETVDGTPTSELPPGLYVGTHYDEKGRGHYEKVAETATQPAAKAELSGPGVETIKQNADLTQTVQVNDAGAEYIGYAHVLNKDEQKQTVVEETTATATEIMLRSTKDWPPFGTARCGNEIFSWTGTTSKSLIGATRGLAGTTPQVFSKGTTCTFPGESYLGGITRQQAGALLDKDLIPCIAEIQRLKAPLNQNHVNALGSLCFRMGPKAFSNSTVVSALNKGNFAECTTEFMRYNRSPKNVLSFVNGTMTSTLINQVNPGLTRCCAQDAKLFCTPATSALRNTVNTTSSGYHPSQFEADINKDTLGGGFSGARPKSEWL